MMADEYFEKILVKYNSNLDKTTVEQIRTEIQNFLSQWAGTTLNEVKISGSYAKGTNTSLSSDFDIFVSFTSNTQQTNKEIYELLENKLKEKYSVKRQNVSLGINASNKKVDVVPGKNQVGNTNDHWLYSTKKDSIFKTNIHKHITLVTNSTRIKEIKITKIWSKLHNLEFPSIYIELIVLDALNGCDISKLDLNFQKVLKYLYENIENSRIVDPANTNNIISEYLTQQEKKIIAQKAKEGCDSQNWGGVVW